MISLDAVRAAALGDQPWARLDDLVRADLAAGRKVKEVADDFIRLRHDVWATPGLSEDGGDAFGDTLDALTGNCQSDCCYKDPPNTSPPTEEEIATLPRWAQVAFAARCARRVFSLYPHFYPDAPGQQAALEGGTVSLAEQSAATAWDAVSGSRVLYGAVFADTPMPAIAVAQVVGGLVGSVKATDTQPYHVAQLAIKAVAAAYRIADITPAVRRDFDRLVRVDAWQHWTDDTPVPPDVFGPLWPEGPPPGWPTDPDVPQRSELPVSFLVSERVDPAALNDESLNVFNALNRYYIARTGQRLTLEGDVRTLLAALVPLGV